MKSRKFGAQVAAIALSAAALLNPAMAQSKGTLYAFNTGAAGACPGLNWHLTVTGNDIEGFVAWDRGQHMARLEGKIVPAAAGRQRSFKMDAKEVGGTGRTATVSGNLGGQFIAAMIDGSGSACDGKFLNIPRVAGGMGGGGG